MNVFASYPVNSHENPFDIYSNGKYFAYLTNRQLCFSYLSNDLSDFGWGNNELYHAMPMGYTNLYVLERIFIVESNSKVYKFSDKKYDKICTFRYEGFPKEEWNTFVEDEMWKNRIQYYHRELFVKNNVDDAIKCSVEFLNRIKDTYGLNNLIVLGAGLIDNYRWH